jgi:hypothetical protein
MCFFTVAPTDYRGFGVFWGGVTGRASLALLCFGVASGHFLEAAKLAENHHIG